MTDHPDWDDDASPRRSFRIGFTIAGALVGMALSAGVILAVVAILLVAEAIGGWLGLERSQALVVMLILSIGAIVGGLTAWDWRSA